MATENYESRLKAAIEKIEKEFFHGSKNIVKFQKTKLQNWNDLQVTRLGWSKGCKNQTAGFYNRSKLAINNG